MFQELPGICCVYSPEKIEERRMRNFLVSNLQKKFLFLGVNALCKGIEEKNVASCVLDSEVSPRILVSHVAELAKNAKVPVLAIRNLKKTVQSVLGFSSLALGFLKSVEEDSSNTFHEVCLCIIQTAKLLKTYEVPQEDILPIEYNLEIKNDVKEANIADENNPAENNTLEDVSRKKNSKNCLNITDKLENIYLYRNSENVRTFRPPTYDDVKSPTITIEEIKDCIQLNSEEEKFDQIDCCKKQRYFTPLVVKRVQSNPNKKKKKNKLKKK